MTGPILHEPNREKSSAGIIIFRSLDSKGPYPNLCKAKLLPKLVNVVDI